MYMQYFICFSNKIKLDFIYRVSIDELQKHTELDDNKENEFTSEEARVNICI